MSDQQVQRLLGAPALRPLIDRVVQRIARGRPLTGQVVLAALGPDEQAAIAALLGRPIGTGSTAAVRLEDVDRIIRQSGAAVGIREAVTALRGPITVVSDAAERDRARRLAVLEPLRALAARRPEYAGFAARQQRFVGLLSSAIGALGMDTVRDLVTVLDALPTSGETLAAFAARVLHSAHALDRGRLRSLVESAIDDLVDEPDVDLLTEVPPIEPAERWASVGIAVDSLASSVLVHGVRFDRGEPVGTALDALVVTGQPVLVTLRMLLAGARPDAREVYVCENPAVLIAAADRCGTACAPILCVRGQPSAAAQRLLRLLADSGAVLRYHGDFDWGGLRIANRLVERYGAVPWRYSTADLLSAAAIEGDELAGDPVEAVWDEGLAAAIEDRGERLEEEQVLASLLADLQR